MIDRLPYHQEERSLSTQEQALRYEAILRSFEVPLDPDSSCYISVGRRNPSRELLDHLEARFHRERIRFRKASEALEVPRDGIVTIDLVDPSTGEGVRFYCFASVELTAPDKAIAEVETLGCGTQYTLQREGDGWVVVSERMTWIA